MDGPQNLELVSMIGFDGNTSNGLVLHPDGVHLVYALGNTVTAYHWTAKKQRFFKGNDSIVTSVAVSKAGKYVGAGYMLSVAYVWDFGTGNVVAAFTAHVHSVQSIAFSCCENYLITLGGLDDGSVVAYDIDKGDVLCIDPSVNPVVDYSVVLRTLHTRNDNFVVAGVNILRLWTVNKEQQCFQRVDASLAKIKRVMLCAEIDHADEHVFCGTSTGDVLKIKLPILCDAGDGASSSSSSSSSTLPARTARSPTLAECFGKHPTGKKRGAAAVELYSQGITSLYLVADGTTMVVGTGAGLVELARQSPRPESGNGRVGPAGKSRLATPTRPLLVAVRSATVSSRVTSLQMMRDTVLLVATAGNELFAVTYSDFSVVRIFTCHTDVVHDMAFPRNCSHAFATTSWQDVRVWSVETLQELLRVTVTNCTCSGVVFAPDGAQIITTWSDGRIRSFAPESGRPLYTIHNCHNKGVSTIAVHPDGRRLLSGGGDGRVCVWLVVNGISTLVAELKDHKSMVSAIDVHRNGDRAVSASRDGTCVIWDLKRYVRICTIFSDTVLTDVQYHPNDLEIIMCGTNGYIGYWDATDGTAITKIETFSGSSLNSLDLTPAGNYFATGSADQLVEVWHHKEGKTTHVGMGHAGAVTNVRVSPDCKLVVSTSVDSGLLLWRFPYVTEVDPPSNQISVPPTACSLQEQLTNRSRQLSQKKTLPPRKENIKLISKTQKVVADAICDTGNGNGKATNKGGGGSVKCLCPRGTKCACNGDSSRISSSTGSRFE